MKLLSVINAIYQGRQQRMFEARRAALREKAAARLCLLLGDALVFIEHHDHEAAGKVLRRVLSEANRAGLPSYRRRALILLNTHRARVVRVQTERMAA